MRIFWTLSIFLGSDKKFPAGLSKLHSACPEQHFADVLLCFLIDFETCLAGNLSLNLAVQMTPGCFSEN